MGRWAQRRVRGGGGGVAAAPLTVIGASLAGPLGEDIDLTFSDAFTFNAAPTDGTIEVDGTPPVTWSQMSATVLRLEPASPASPGSTWAITAQPTCIDEPVAAPQGGSV